MELLLINRLDTHWLDVIVIDTNTFNIIDSWNDESDVELDYFLEKYTEEKK